MLERIYEYLKKKYSNYGNICFEDRYSYARREDLHTLKLTNDLAVIEWYIFSDEPTEIFIAEHVEFKNTTISKGRKYYSHNFDVLEYNEEKVDLLMNFVFGDTIPTFIKTEIKPIVNVKTPETKQKSLFSTAVFKSQVAIQTAIPNGKKKKLF